LFNCAAQQSTLHDLLTKLTKNQEHRVPAVFFDENSRLNAAASALTQNWSQALDLLWSAGYAGLQLDMVGSNAVAAGLLGGTTASL